MARRRQMRIDPSVFLQQQGGGDEAKQLEMAMEMLGFGKGEGSARGQLQLGREQLVEQAGWHGRGQDIEEQKLAAENKKASEEEAFRQYQIREAADLKKQALEYQQAQLANEAMKSRLDVAKTMMGDTSIPIADRQKMWAQFDPAIKDMLAVGAEQADKAAARNLLPQVQEAYKKGDVDLIKKLAAANPEISQRPEFEWTKWNQEMPGPQPGILERLRNLVGGGERERAATEATKVAPPPEAAGPTTPRPMAFTGYEPPVEGPVRRGYGAVSGGGVGPALPAILAKIMGPAAPPSSGRGYYTPDVPIAEAPAPVVSAVGQGEAWRHQIPQTPVLPLQEQAPSVSAVGQGGAWQHQIPQAAQLQRPEEALVRLFAPEVSAVQPGGYQPGAEFPRQPVIGAAPAGPQWTVQDLLSKLMMDRSEQERLPWTYGPWNPPIGGGMPPPVGGLEIDSRLLGQPRRLVGE